MKRDVKAIGGFGFKKMNASTNFLNKLKCDLCGRVFHKQFGLQCHKKSSHGQKIKPRFEKVTLRSRQFLKDVTDDDDIEEESVESDDDQEAVEVDDDTDAEVTETKRPKKPKPSPPIASFDLETAESLSSLDVFSPQLRLKDIYKFKESETTLYDLPDKDEASNRYNKRLTNTELESCDVQADVDHVDRDDPAAEPDDKGSENMKLPMKVTDARKTQKRKSNTSQLKGNKSLMKRSKPSAVEDETILEEITLDDDDEDVAAEQVIIEYDTLVDTFAWTNDNPDDSGESSGWEIGRNSTNTTIASMDPAEDSSTTSKVPESKHPRKQTSTKRPSKAQKNSKKSKFSIEKSTIEEITLDDDDDESFAETRADASARANNSSDDSGAGSSWELSGNLTNTSIAGAPPDTTENKDCSLGFKKPTSNGTKRNIQMTPSAAKKEPVFARYQFTSTPIGNRTSSSAAANLSTSGSDDGIEILDSDEDERTRKSSTDAQVLSSIDENIAILLKEAEKLKEMRTQRLQKLGVPTGNDEPTKPEVKPKPNFFVKIKAESKTKKRKATAAKSRPSFDVNEVVLID